MHDYFRYFMYIDDVCKRKSRMITALLSCIGWFPVAVFAIFIKKVNIELRYFDLFYKYSNIGAHPKLADYLSFYKNDIIYNFIIIPMLIAGIVYLYPKRKTIYLIAIVSLSMLILLFANLHSWGTLGMPINYTALNDATVFALQSPEFISMYIDNDSWIKLSVLISASMFGHIFAGKLAGVRVLNLVALVTIGVIFISSFIFVLIGSTSDMKKSKVSGNFISLSIVSFFGFESESKNYSKMNKDEIMESFYKLTKTKNNHRPIYRSKAKGNDLIVLILETGPTKFIDLENEIQSFPTMKELSKNSLISYNHFTTYPGSSQALFSLFLSTYPPKNYYKSCISNKDKYSSNFPGFISKLKDAGYSTNLYLPVADTIPIDKILHNNLGFNKIYFPEHDQHKNENQSDLVALNEMKKDISSFIDKGVPYVSVFLPQTGHAPWKDRPEAIPVKAYGKKLAAIQDEWLGQIVNILKSKGKLDSTTIVVTADHGIRTTKEDPSFNMGFIDEYTYRVPLLIYSPASFPETIIIKDRTSHLDISPSLLDLFGISKTNLLEQGLCLWDESIHERDLYLLGNWHCNMDGYYSEGRYFMYHEVLDLYFGNTSLTMGFNDVINDQNTNKTIKDKIDKLYEIQDSFYESILCRD